MWREENQRTPRKTLRARQEPTTNSTTYDAGSRIQTRVTLLGGKHSHHCTIPAPLVYTLQCNLHNFTWQETSVYIYWEEKYFSASEKETFSQVLVPVVQIVDNAIYWIVIYLVDVTVHHKINWGMLDNFDTSFLFL